MYEIMICWTSNFGKILNQLKHMVLDFKFHFPMPPVMALLMAPPITVPTTTSPMVGAGATTTLEISGRLSDSN